jgi:hypothetical protein
MDFSVLIRYLIDRDNRLSTPYNVAVRAAEEFMRPQHLLIVISLFICFKAFATAQNLPRAARAEVVGFSARLDTRQSAGP